MTTSSPTLAVALIVKNEAKHLKACLDTVADWVDEIVIMDSGSTDSTEKIAREFTNKFIVNEEWPGFGKQRQLAQQHITSDYVLWLDADERVTPELKSEILSAVEENKTNTAYKINRSSSAFGKLIKYSGWSPDWVVRLYKTSDTQYSDSLVHESVVIPNHIQVNALNGRLLHFTYDALQQYNAKNVMYIKSWVDQREGKKKGSLSSAFLHGFFCFIRMYILKRGFLDGRHGLLLATLSASVTFNRYADLWLRDYNKSNKE
ncbi:glycosyltransferase family 2 protein [Aliivibrio wodanis]|uniref:glycosyltransferase family 2 protein n=1 Tax=Aliivibrio wodanis TaxID=80852 RepID=UPI00406C78B0